MRRDVNVHRVTRTYKQKGESMTHTPNPMAEALANADYFLAGEIAADEISRLENEKAGLLEALGKIANKPLGNVLDAPINWHILSAVVDIAKAAIAQTVSQRSGRPE